VPTRVVLPIHGGDHCPGGPDEMPCIQIPACLMTDYIYEDDGLIPSETWQQIGEGTDRYFSEGWRSDGDWNLDFEAGQITRLNTGMYLVVGSVAFDAIPAGTNIQVGIRMNNSSSFFHHVDSIATGTGSERVTIAAPWWGVLTADLWARHDDPSGQAVGMAELHAYFMKSDLTPFGELLTYPEV